MMKRFGLNNEHALAAIALAAMLTAAPVAAQTPSDNDQELMRAISNSHRTAAFVARDKYRHPQQTLEFFGIRPNMTVIEVLPGSGWYTEILAPYLKDHGHLIEALPPTSTSNAYEKRESEKYMAKLKAEETAYGTVAVIPFEPPTQMALGPVNSADLIVTFLNIHDLVYMNAHHEVTSYFLESFFKSAFTALKPGGVLGVVEHRAPKGTDIATSLGNLRLPQDYVVAAARTAGFQTVETSEISANARDSGTEPVWYFPPMLKSPPGKQNHYKAIDESDDMTLRLMKPKN